MTQQTKRKIKNAAKTGGKYTLQGVKFAEKTALGLTELTAKAVEKTAEVIGNKDVRRFIAGAGTIAAGVTFMGPVISVVAMKYLTDNILLGKKVSPVEALSSTFRASEKVLDGVLGVVTTPTKVVAKEVGKLAHKGKEALDR